MSDLPGSTGGGESELARIAQVIHDAHRTAPYPWWHVEADKCQVAPWIAKAVLAALQEPPK